MRFSQQSFFVALIVIGVGGFFLGKLKSEEVRPVKSLHSEKSAGLILEGSLEVPRAREKEGPTAQNSRAIASGGNSEAITNRPGALSSAKETPLEGMAQVLFTYSRPDSSIADLTGFLSSAKQKPLLAKQSNPDTGEMSVVRTENPLPGTRYFHAQYFTDEKSQSFLQHMSFEFRPGDSAMSEAIAAVQKAFPSLSRPLVRTPSFIKWAIDERYILWIKKLGATDLQDNPFNAYTKNDLGTVRVAVEAEIH